MYKACLLFLCLLAFTPTMRAQDTSRPDLERIRKALRDARTPEQPARGRDLTPSPAPEQRSLDWLFKPSAVVPPGPIPTLSDVPAIGDWGVVDLKGFNGINYGWSEADSAEFNRGLEDIRRITVDCGRIVEDIGRAVEELNRINRAYAVPNPPPVSSPGLLFPVDDTFSPQPSASAASRGPIRAQASGLKLPKFIENLFTKPLTCKTKCEVLFFTKCVNKEIGPKGGYSTHACVQGRTACKQECH
jgi:hypothetical protein